LGALGRTRQRGCEEKGIWILYCGSSVVDCPAVISVIDLTT
ncbi:hypothetical protein A2U01_0100173, partial [Trifolium medium]|nr:hypothetical protein [Trifolium medium]